MNRKTLIILAGGLVVVMIALTAMVMKPGGQATTSTPQSKMLAGTNPTLDIRYQYDANMLTPGIQNPRAEYPLQLDGNGWGLYGKRIRGLGSMLEQSPDGVLFDFVASQHADTYENWFKLEMLEEKYEDVTINGKLAVHCTWLFERTADSLEWPKYFPDQVKAGTQVYMQGWTLFSNNDLFYYYTFSATPISETEEASVLALLNSLEYGALFDSDRTVAKGATSRAEEGRPGFDETKKDEATTPDEPAGE